ncbi:serine/threonine-protein kinase [Singulisphaera acidiphila]|uniref:Protein kinase family protein n=1 Tax=Singulisphaera acidiphila (strain ATCC BAA-1392 / DSM 18658 / VKM B-2454 / MOB10) TaxID=886293 RepID=L0DC53_SINAD|nr:serine/threonine-protein kinase [Singulisphaera acidiphila]AGA26435.1 protein kinase family protein [Singulisphaera acidiphila DSM 18658]
MNDPSSDLNQLGGLAEEFLDRRSRGERPTVTEYAEQYPELADQIRAFFPALMVVEDLKPRAEDLTNSFIGGLRPTRGLSMERLGDFRIIREVGRGGMGVVYEAEQESLSRRVALKVLGSPSLLDPKRLARFQREAKAAARLHHTNIVPVFGVGEVDGVHYYVMQFILGAGLDEVLDDVRRLQASKTGQPVSVSPREPLGGPSASVAFSLLNGRPGPLAEPVPPQETPWPSTITDSSDPSVVAGPPALSVASETGPSYARSIARIGAHVAEALGYAHEQGILHRDIKPSNILLDNHGTPWVTDFGLAKATADEDLTHTGDIVGTIRYMAPERFHGRCDALSDVYALGLTLYELLARVPAFEGADRNQLIRQVHLEEPPRLRKRDPTIPRDLETIVHKAIEKDPGHRYLSAVALAEDLRRFLEDRPILARRATLTERTRRWSRRNRTTAALAVTTAGSVLLAAVVGWTGYVITTQALKGEQNRRTEAEIATRQAREATRRAEENVSLSLEVFEELFEKLAANDNHLLPPPPGLPHVQHKPNMDPPPPPPEENLDRPPPPPRGPGGPFDRMAFPMDAKHGPPPGRSEEDTALLESMLMFYDRFAQRNATNPRLQGEAAWAYRKVGALYSRLGRDQEAESAYQRAITMFEELIVQFPDVTEYRSRLVETYIMADPWSSPPASLEQLEQRLRRAQVLIDKLGDESPENLGYIQERVHVYAKLGAVLQRRKQLAAASACYEQAIALGGSLIQRSHNSRRALLDRAFSEEALALLQYQRGQNEETRRLLNAAVSDLRTLSGEDSMFSPPPESFETLAESFTMLGDTARAEEIRRWAAAARTRPRGFPLRPGRGSRPSARNFDPSSHTGEGRLP